MHVADCVTNVGLIKIHGKNASETTPTSATYSLSATATVTVTQTQKASSPVAGTFDLLYEDKLFEGRIVVWGILLRIFTGYKVAKYQ